MHYGQRLANRLAVAAAQQNAESPLPSDDYNATNPPAKQQQQALFLVEDKYIRAVPWL